MAEIREASQAGELTRVYEIGYHIVPSRKEDELEGVVAQVRAIIEKEGGKLLAEGAPSLQRLSYPISITKNGTRTDHDRGYFGWIKFEGPFLTSQVLEKALAGMTDILRSVVFKTVREETRARFRPSIREVRRGDVLRPAPRKEETAAPVSEEDLDKALENLTSE